MTCLLRKSVKMSRSLIDIITEEFLVLIKLSLV
ncbi:hypothetical protein DFH44_004125 [Clostridium beijerinckii]|nr:hypothetical protein [Clostridium beijerinckii]NRU11991.1 hypothetical protein [Clostridium beijerinckii]NRU84085.1 hypothetical protein [Clostridium beijerinckii]NRV92113.1 hypothetical protein [Clostridium beijerinckii]NRW27341.1 hypothetical protein [Clostridium beijerinckii]